MTTKAKNIQPTTDAEVATYAYYLWESDGRKDGLDMEYWLQAKAQLIARREHEAGLWQTSSLKTTGSARKSPEVLTDRSSPKMTRKRSSCAAPDSIYA